MYDSAARDIITHRAHAASLSVFRLKSAVSYLRSPALRLPSPVSRLRSHPGSTLVEQLVVITLIGICMATTVSTIVRLIDSAQVHAASRNVAELLAFARDRAIATGQRTAVRFDGTRNRVVVHSGTDTIARLALHDVAGVALSASRDSLSYQSSGLGYGAANLRVIVSRGAVQDTITVSRLGRVRR